MGVGGRRERGDGGVRSNMKGRDRWSRSCMHGAPREGGGESLGVGELR